MVDFAARRERRMLIRFAIGARQHFYKKWQLFLRFFESGGISIRNG
jgi:hypothetical protein